jgi:uncharacterized protein YbjQ (UPF0145 family)
MSLFLEYFELVLFLVLLALGYTIGRMKEQRHYQSIRRRERELAGVLAFAVRFPPDPNSPRECVLVTGSVVVSSDYFKQFVAGLRTLIGGRMASYESLLDRARREAVLRMKADAARHGANMILNVKVESTNVGGGFRGGVPAMEVFAYGTALKNAPDRREAPRAV